VAQGGGASGVKEAYAMSVVTLSTGTDNVIVGATDSQMSGSADWCAGGGGGEGGTYIYKRVVYALALVVACGGGCMVSHDTPGIGSNTNSPTLGSGWSACASDVLVSARN
jgi:hypothetical protein